MFWTQKRKWIHRKKDAEDGAAKQEKDWKTEDQISRYLDMQLLNVTQEDAEETT